MKATCTECGLKKSIAIVDRDGVYCDDCLDTTEEE